jgi:hypothetical protein
MAAAMEVAWGLASGVPLHRGLTQVVAEGDYRGAVITQLISALPYHGHINPCPMVNQPLPDIRRLHPG